MWPSLRERTDGAVTWLLAGRSTNEAQKSGLNVCSFICGQCRAKVPSPRTFTGQDAFEHVECKTGARGVHRMALPGGDSEIPTMNQVVGSMDAQGQRTWHAT